MLHLQHSLYIYVYIYMNVCSKMNLDLRKRLVKFLVWSVALYAAEPWTISKTDMKRIEAFEMWIWRKMEKISWTAKVSKL